MIVTEDSFWARFFSKDCSNIFDNSLSSFSCQFDEELVFLDDYEVGLSEMFLNPSQISHARNKSSVDYINLPASLGDKTYSLHQFIKHLLAYSLSPSLFTRSYFHSYLDKNYFFESQTLNEDMPNEINDADEEDNKSKPINVEIDLGGLLLPGESFTDFIPPHDRGKLSEEKFKKFTIFTSSNRSTRLIKVLNNMIRFILYKLRGRKEDGDSRLQTFSTKFFEDKSKYDTTDIMNNERRKVLFRMNQLIHRFVERFVGTVLKVQDEMKAAGHLTHPDPTELFLFLYCNVITKQLVGPNFTKLLYLTPFQAESRPQHTHVTISKINYCRLESRKIKTISFLMTSEFGSQINFIPAVHSNWISLHFRKVRKV